MPLKKIALSATILTAIAPVLLVALIGYRIRLQRLCVDAEVESMCTRAFVANSASVVVAGLAVLAGVVLAWVAYGLHYKDIPTDKEIDGQTNDATKAQMQKKRDDMVPTSDLLMAGGVLAVMMAVALAYVAATMPGTRKAAYGLMVALWIIPVVLLAVSVDKMDGESSDHSAAPHDDASAHKSTVKTAPVDTTHAETNKMPVINIPQIHSPVLPQIHFPQFHFPNF